MDRRVSKARPWVWASVSAALATVAVAGAEARMIRGRVSEIALLDPRAPFDPYDGLAEYALSVEPAR